MRSLKSVDSWWCGRLMAGTTTEREEDWHEGVPSENLFNDYIATAEKIGEKRKREETIFGIELRKLLPDEQIGGQKIKNLDRFRTNGLVIRKGVEVERRVPHYKLPMLMKARELFERAVKQYLPWPKDGHVPHSHLGSEREN